MVGCKESSSVSKRNQSLLRISLKHHLTLRRYLLPGEDVPSDEASENVIGSDHTDSSHDEELSQSVLSEKV